MINIVIPMAGLGSRFAQSGYIKAKPFIDVMGEPMIIHVIKSLGVPRSRIILIARKEHVESEHEVFARLSHEFNAQVVPISKVTEGAACTVLYARSLINSDEPLLTVNSDQVVDIPMQAFIDDCTARQLDGSILTFRDMARDPKWSFAAINQDGLVTKCREKEPISEHATVGAYYFARGRDYVDNAIQMIIENNRSNQEFYVCPVYNYLIAHGARIGIYDIKPEQMHGIGTPTDLNRYLERFRCTA
jgi:dTDP-glucose pyrophosphorylase